MTTAMTASALAHRDVLPAGEPVGTLLCLHGYPESSHMWRATLDAAARAGWRAVAPDLPGYGDSPLGDPADGAGTWEGHVDALTRFHDDLGLGPVVLCVHDWGGLIGLRWACDAPDRVSGLVISASGFFPDGKWHGLAQTLRTPGEGEQLADSMTREGFTAMLGAVSRMDAEAVDACWQAYATPERRAAHLALYRSGDFEKLEPYAGRLAALGVPALLALGERGCVRAARGRPAAARGTSRRAARRPRGRGPLPLRRCPRAHRRARRGLPRRGGRSGRRVRRVVGRLTGRPPLELVGRVLPDRDDHRVASSGACGDRQRCFGAGRLEDGHRDVAPAQRVGEAAHAGDEMIEAADGAGHLAARRVHVERRELAHVRQRGRRHVQLDPVGEVHDAVAEVDLDHREAAALDDGGPLAGVAVHEPDRAQRARAVDELAQRRDGAVEGADARHELDPIVLRHGARR